MYSPNAMALRALPLLTLVYADSSLRLGLQSGSVIAVPIPEEHEARGAVIQEAVLQALEEAKLVLAHSCLVPKLCSPFCVVDSF